MTRQDDYDSDSPRLDDVTLHLSVFCNKQSQESLTFVSILVCWIIFGLFSYKIFLFQIWKQMRDGLFTQDGRGEASNLSSGAAEEPQVWLQEKADHEV